MIVTILNVVIDGLLLGGLYALISMGLSLQYGVARVLNIAHGEFLMLGALATWSLYTMLHINPLVSLAIVGPVALVAGFLLYRTLFTRLRVISPTPGAFEGNSMLAAFGVLFIIQNIALLVWGPEIRGYSYLSMGVDLGGAVFAANRLVTLAFAVSVGLVFYAFLARTRMGKAIRAAAEDASTAGLMGVNINQVLALCFGLGALMAGIAGALISLCYPSIRATMGLEYTVIAVIVVVLGGLGSIAGSFIGGVIMGLIGSIVAYREPGLALVAYYVIFMFLLLIKPTGILGR